ncbi:MAG: Cytochrome c oxidase subunit CcoP [Fibrobacteres bacterium]|nr:Cytochrome c oxidase subunit CcoP [Fibrobacterota bacterium]
MEEKDKLLESHQDNDGIREYDNPLPNWFVYLFYGCIIQAVLYMAFYTGQGWALSRSAGVGQSLGSSGAEYMAAVRMAEKETGSAQAREFGGEELVAFLKSPSSISGGEAVFKSNCVACHGEKGQGVVGPNLTDAYWLHGGSPQAVLASVTGGYPDKGMPAWKPVLGAEKVRQAAAFVLSLRGNAVANPKAPQGVKEP